MRESIGWLCIVFAADLGAREIDFVRDVRPIFQARCYECHGPETQKSGLRLDVRQAALTGGEFHAPNIVPGNPDGSNLVRFVRGDDPDVRMPAKGEPLSPDEIETLAAWVEQGARWPDGVDAARLEDRADHWSFKPLAPFDARRSIDGFIAERLAENGLSMAPPADRLTWLRRVTFGLTGLPPTMDEVTAFLDDTSQDAYQRVVDRVLASPRYGERWAQHWLDAIRYADTDGFEVNTPRPNAWPYRDYVIAALNADTPYDRFIREQLAGDQLGVDAATGFLVTAARLLPGQIGADPASMRLARQDELGEIVINTSEALLGLTVACARCHNHKFDAISARDYYTFQAFFAGVTYGDREIASPEKEVKRQEALRLEERVRQLDRELARFVPAAGSGVKRPPVSPAMNVERFAPVKARRVRFTILATNQLEACLDELEVFDDRGCNVAAAAAGTSWKVSGSHVAADRHQPEFINDGLYGNSRSWMCSDTQGWVMLEFPSEYTIEWIVWGRDREGKFTDRLATEYRIEVADASDASDAWRTVADSSDRSRGDTPPTDPLAGLADDQRDQAEALQAERSSLAKQVESLRAVPQVFGGLFGPPEPMHRLNRGDPEQPQEEVAPAVFAALGSVRLPMEAPDPDRRLALADWIASPDNPLTARVMVNRLWQGHFGIGLVESSNDFGRAGTPPSHPALLDWLAAEFIRSGWSIKHMHRLITLSLTYRQSARLDPVAQAKDADGRWLWRFPSKRLEAEAMRDSILAVTGQLNLKMGGPGFDLFESRGGLSGFPPIEAFSGDGLRRMVYAHKIRMEPDAVFGAFDCPDAGQSVARRRQSTTPVQALNLFNSRFVIDQAEALATRVRASAGEDAASQIDLMYRLAYGRRPEAREAEEMAAALREHGLPVLCRALLNSNEFLFIP
ncbi:MAG: PSD1 and planctomycete cytochrome C domain-containing protein [Verrucomicrobiales bacterium]